MPHWKSLIDNDYIGAFAFGENEEITATIKAVVSKPIKDNKGEEKRALIVIFAEKDLKPLVTNKTNAASIVALVGGDAIFANNTDNWIGKRITMFASTTMAFGEMKECVRIRPTVADTKKKKGIVADRFTKGLEQIKAGKFTRQAMLDMYELTAEQQTELDVQAPAQAQIEGGTGVAAQS